MRLRVQKLQVRSVDRRSTALRAVVAFFFGALVCTAQASAGMSAYYAGDYGTALRLLKPIAEQGDPRTETLLGFMYQLGGRGLTQDFEEAAKWYRLATAQGDPLAEYNLAFMYEHGNGVAQDYRTALDLYRKSAEQGNPMAQVNIAVLYKNGNGVAQDYAEAIRWYRLAADRLPAAQAALARTGNHVRNGLGSSTRLCASSHVAELGECSGQR